MTAFVKYLALATVLFAIVSLPVAGAEPKLPIVRQYAPGVTEIISQLSETHLPVILVGDENLEAAKVRAAAFRKVGHPVYLMPECDGESFLELARGLQKRYCLPSKVEVRGKACDIVAEVYRRVQAKEKLFVWVHAEDVPDAFRSDDLAVEQIPTPSKSAFAQRTDRPVSFFTNTVGRTVIDFGVDAFGWPETRFPLPVSGIVGEKLDGNGSVDRRRSAIRSAFAEVGAGSSGWRRLRYRTDFYSRMRCISIPRKCAEIIPFRYLELDADVPVAAVAEIRRIALEYPFDVAQSGFDSSSLRLNAVYDLCKYTMRATVFAGIYIDGDRERTPYEADAYVTQLSNYAISSDYEPSRITHEYLLGNPTWPTEYKLISILTAWSYWMWSGNTEMLAKYYGQLKSENLMERFRRERDGILETGGERGKGAYEGAADMVDWPICERFGFEFKKANAVINAFYAIALQKMADIAGCLGKCEDRSAFLARLEVLKSSYQNSFFDQALGLYVDGEGSKHVSLHANSMAILAGLVPDEHRDGVGRWIASREMECSVYFAQFFLEALFAVGRGDRAIELMTAENDRSWSGMIESGATMTKESWNDAVKNNIDWNHSWATAPVNLIARCLAGVTPAESGFASASIAPSLSGLERFSALVPTPKGGIRVRCQRKNSDEILEVETPVPSSVRWAGRTFKVDAGRHRFSTL